MNSSSLDNSSLNNSTVNETDLEKEFVFNRQAELLAHRIFLELFTVASLICITVNILIIFVILRYRRLRQDKANIILLNWAIVNSLFMFSTPLTFRLIFEWSQELENYFMVYCVVEQFEHNFLLANLLLIMLLMVYWYLRVYYRSKFEKLERHLVFFVATVYIFCAFCLGVDIYTCHHLSLYGIANVILFFSYVIFFVFMLVMNILHAIKKRRLITEQDDKRNLPLILSNTFFLTYLMTLLALLGGLIIDFTFITILAIVYVSFYVAILTPLYFFIILYKHDRDFNTFFRHVITCRCKKYEEEFQEQQVVYNNGVDTEDNKC